MIDHPPSSADQAFLKFQSMPASPLYTGLARQGPWERYRFGPWITVIGPDSKACTFLARVEAEWCHAFGNPWSVER